ncbi:MAG: L,D-transpeptidase family protein [bacterium]|nr:L,D-transpeptidase family protein [bacterium]
MPSQRPMSQRPAKNGRAQQQPFRNQPNMPVRPPVTNGQLRVPPPVSNSAPQQPRQQPRQILSVSQRMRAMKLSASGQPTMPYATNTTRQADGQPMPLPMQPNRAQPHTGLPARKSPTASAKNRRNLLIAAGLLSVGLFAFVCFGLTLGAMMIYGSGILPGVSAAGVDLGGMSEAEAAAALQNEWQTITLRDGDRRFSVSPASLGITLDAAQTAAQAHRQGRGEGNVLAALTNTEVAPVVSVDVTALAAGLEALRGQVDVPAVDAGVALVNGVVQATPAENGRALDVNVSAVRLQNRDALADGEIELAMSTVTPAVTDSTPMVQAAQQLLTSPMNIRAFDPATGDTVTWSAPPETWARWLTSGSAPGTASGLALSVQPAPVRDFLTAQAAALDETRTLNLDEAVAQVQAAVAASNTSPTIRVYHNDRQHVVQSGETITSIAYDYGVPYPYVQQANGGIEALSVGQTITIPSVDEFLPLEVVPNKRIEVSIPEQRVRVYENGQLIQDWPASTGISSSPTWPGVYQILSHEPNAYAANWNLWMPNFMGVYQPVPGTAFTNGFHGFPTRGGGQILWENSLGTRVTYGCILLSNQNVQWLYDWAEEGVVVEIQG